MTTLLRDADFAPAEKRIGNPYGVTGNLATGEDAEHLTYNRDHRFQPLHLLGRLFIVFNNLGVCLSLDR
jgi:hypothetical protein